MSVDAAMLEQARSMVATVPEHAAADLSPLTSVPEVLAYVATAARSGEVGEADMVELVVRLAGLTPAEIRDAEFTLRRLGYAEVCARLREIAGRRRTTLRPLS
jgi:hypothetical protein